MGSIRAVKHQLGTSEQRADANEPPASTDPSVPASSGGLEPPTPKDNLTPEEAELCKRAGWDPERYLHRKKEGVEHQSDRGAYVSYTAPIPSVSQPAPATTPKAEPIPPYHDRSLEWPGFGVQNLQIRERAREFKEDAARLGLSPEKLLREVNENPADSKAGQTSTTESRRLKAEAESVNTTAASFATLFAGWI